MRLLAPAISARSNSASTRRLERRSQSRCAVTVPQPPRLNLLAALSTRAVTQASARARTCALELLRNVRASSWCRRVASTRCAQIINKPTGSKIAMLKAEVDILTRCDHPNVVKMHACYETDKILYLVLELVQPPARTNTLMHAQHALTTHTSTVRRSSRRAAERS